MPFVLTTGFTKTDARALASVFFSRVSREVRTSSDGSATSGSDNICFAAYTAPAAFSARRALTACAGSMPTAASIGIVARSSNQVACSPLRMNRSCKRKSRRGTLRKLLCMTLTAMQIIHLKMERSGLGFLLRFRAELKLNVGLNGFWSAFQPVASMCEICWKSANLPFDPDDLE